MGVEGLNLFADQLLDLKPQIASTGYQSTGVDPALVDFFNSLGQNGATVGLPFAVYPSFIFYNKDLFEEADLPLPPTKVGDLYDGKPWDLDALRTLAMKLTVDKNGKDATDPAFDAANIEQWGFESQYMDNYNLRAESAWFGTGALLGADGKAVIPDSMAQGAKWYNDGVWKDHFIPTAAQVASDLLTRWQRVRLRQHRHQRGPHLVHLLRQSAGRQEALQVRVRRAADRQRQDHVTAPRRHLQHPQDHQGPGCGLQGPDRHGGVARNC